MANQPDLPLHELAEGTVFTVSEFLDLINELVGAHDYSVQGEVTEVRTYTGFMFVTLKDEREAAVITCFLPGYVVRNAGFIIEVGLKIKIHGLGKIRKEKGTFSFQVASLELAGEGMLKKAYEALKQKLTEEGLFDRKRPLPNYVRTIGLITSKTGAVIDDFRRNLIDLGMTVYHRDVRVEGATAVGQIAAAIRAFDRGTHHIDVLVIIRGGGSMEDLQAFNNEQVVRAVFGSRVPTVVSIGHDRDIPLAQMAADASASTPTAVAHLVNETWSPLTQRLPQLTQRLCHIYESALASSSADIRALSGRLALHLGRIAGAGNLLHARLVRGLDRIGARIQQVSDAVASAQRHLESSDPGRLLRLGYSIVTDETGAVIRSSADIRHGQVVRTRLARGAFLSQVKELQSTHGEE